MVVGLLPLIAATVALLGAVDLSTAQTSAIPNFAFVPMSDAECSSLNSPNGPWNSAVSRGCGPTAHLVVMPNGYADIPELTTVSNTIAALNKNRPVEIVSWDYQTDPSVYAPIASAILSMSITCGSGATVNGVVRTNNPYVTSSLPTFGVTNLVSYSALSCQNMVVAQQDFASTPNLMELMFFWSTFASIEPGTFVNIPQLQSLSLENGWSTIIKQNLVPPSFPALSVSSIQLLHCDCQYSWLRGFLQQNRGLISTHAAGAIYSVGNLLSASRSLPQIFLGVDCSATNVTLFNPTQTDFTINDPCPV